VPTLYELLGALPQDDADSLRAAFRKAAKANHPDNNPGDPDAPQRFRQIVRAHSILRDETQRAAYDQLLSEAEQQQAPAPRRAAFSVVSLPGPISSMVIASVSIGAFAAIERVMTIPVVIAQMQELSARAIALTAAMPTQASGTVGKVSEKANEKISERTPDTIASVTAPEIPDAVEKTKAPTVLATADTVGTTNSEAAPATSKLALSEPVTPMPAISEPAVSEPVVSEPSIPAPVDPEPVVKDARYYLERGDAAYRIGDFPLALTDFDLAIALDPNSSDAYVNRAIVFSRMGDLKRAFADVKEARRIDEGKHP
jgi:tetratricopeptide (TPR) repeat protein